MGDRLHGRAPDARGSLKTLMFPLARRLQRQGGIKL
jgi:hypothetical protein